MLALFHLAALGALLAALALFLVAAAGAAGTVDWGDAALAAGLLFGFTPPIFAPRGGHD